MKRLVILLATAIAASAPALGGCPKSSPAADGDAAGAGSTATSNASAAFGDAAAASSSAASASSPAAKAGEPTTWTAKYTLASGSLYIPSDKDWKNAKFKNDEEKYLGEGTLTISVDPAGRVTGTSDGPPLGAAVLDGHVDGDRLSATVRRKDPSDNGLTGTIVATIAAEKMEGTMKLSEANAAVVREGKLSASKK